MNMTITQLESIFNRYNKSIFVTQFGVSLPKPKFRISSAKNYIGQFRYRRHDRTGESYEIAISKFFKLDRAELVETIVHEMIHEYIQFNNILDNNVHGKVFHTYMDLINKKHNMNITVKGSNMTVASKKVNRLVAYSINGRRCITKYSVNNEKNIIDYIKRLSFREPVGNVVMMDSNHELTQRMTLSVHKFWMYSWPGTDNVKKIEKSGTNKRRLYISND